MAYWDEVRDPPLAGPLLLVMRVGDCRMVGSIFARWGVEVVWAHSRVAAETILLSRPAFALVITEDQLPDGDWRTVVESVRRAGSRAVVLVKHAEAGVAEERVTQVLSEDSDPTGTLLVSAA